MTMKKPSKTARAYAIVLEKQRMPSGRLIGVTKGEMAQEFERLHGEPLGKRVPELLSEECMIRALPRRRLCAATGELRHPWVSTDLEDVAC